MSQAGQSGSQPSQANQSDDDPTRAVFFSLREEYRNLANGAWNNQFILRRDQVILQNSRGTRPRGVILRADVPIATARSGQETRIGLGDIYLQALLVPYFSRRFAFAAGTGMFFPTATDKTLGTGKWQIAPLAAPVWYLPRERGFFLVKVQNFSSFAGPRHRSDLNFLRITPALFYRPARRWWVQTDAESTTNWNDRNHSDFRVGFQVGRVMAPRFALAVKPELPIGGRKSGDWTLKITGIWYKAN